MIAVLVALALCAALVALGTLTGGVGASLAVDVLTGMHGRRGPLRVREWVGPPPAPPPPGAGDRKAQAREWVAPAASEPRDIHWICCGKGSR